MSQSKKILAQGDRDGGCFFYAIANGAQTLTDKLVSQTQWGKCIKQLPFKVDDFFAGRGTEKLDDNHIYFELISAEFYKTLQIDVKLKSHDDITSSENLKRLITAKSVMLCTIYGDAHWIAVVDVVGDIVYMACSAQALESVEKSKIYLEELSPRLKRTFNLKLEFRELDLWKSYGLLISKK